MARFSVRRKQMLALRRVCSNLGLICRAPRLDLLRALRLQDGRGITHRNQALCSLFHDRNTRRAASFNQRFILVVRESIQSGANKMTLLDAINTLDDLDEGFTIYAAKPWAENSTAIVSQEPATGGLPTEAEKLGLQYFLEVFIARDFLDDWKGSLNEEPTLQEKCARLIQYAINDA